MIKRLMLALCLTTGIAQAEIHRFCYDELLSEMYMRVDNSDMPRIAMQRLSECYLEWSNEVLSNATSALDLIYLNRITGMFNEVMIAYQYGIGGAINKEELARMAQAVDAYLADAKID